MLSHTQALKKILVIRRDNIGDLVLTTPLLRSLRKQLPSAQIDLLTNSYCAPVLNGNTDVDQVLIYEKGHHRGNRSLFRVYFERIQLLWRLRKSKYDYILLGKPSVEPRPLQLARIIGAPRIVGITTPASPYQKYLTNPLYWDTSQGQHVAERCMQLLSAVGKPEPAGPLQIFPDSTLSQNTKKLFTTKFGGKRLICAVQISSRKIKQRWPIDRFVDLIRTLNARHDCAFVLFWSPGSKDNPMHPGDDENAQTIIEHFSQDFPIIPYPTKNLSELIAALASTQMMITSDGGAMHLGAAVGLPILCFFGNSDAQRWHPWSVPYRLIQEESQDVRTITVEKAANEFDMLLQSIKIGNR